METYSDAVFCFKHPPDQTNHRCLYSPVGSISCSCCGNLREVVTDREAARTSHGESLKHTHTPDARFTGKGQRGDVTGFSLLREEPVRCEPTFLVLT